MIGCGFVGASSAFALMQSGIFSEMVMIDADHAKAEGEAMDLSDNSITLVDCKSLCYELSFLGIEIFDEETA